MDSLLGLEFLRGWVLHMYCPLEKINEYWHSYFNVRTTSNILAHSNESSKINCLSALFQIRTLRGGSDVRTQDLLCNCRMESTPP